MDQRLAHLTLLVDDYDKAIAYYTGVLKFRLIEDTWLSESKRWVLVQPQGSGSCSLLLAKAVGEKQYPTLETKAEAGYSCSFIRMISDGIIKT
jgi:catechol 2,3-dioxygenase-like lactoylglutathione lyase family enzyme